VTVRGGIGRRRARLEGLSGRWARVPGIVIASGRIPADTERHTASAAFAFVGRCRRLADIRPLAGLFRPAGALLQRPPDSFRGGSCGETRKRPPREGAFRTAERFCIGFAPAPNQRCVQGSTWAVEKLLAPGRIRLSRFQVRCRYGRC
jgi:hypothetical protein